MSEVLLLDDEDVPRLLAALLFTVEATGSERDREILLNIVSRLDSIPKEGVELIRMAARTKVRQLTGRDY